MKKLSAFVILFSGIFSTAHGQEMKTSPAYDNIHNDEEIMQRISPSGNTKYTLIAEQSNTEAHYQKPAFQLQKIEVIEINAYKIGTYSPTNILYHQLPHYPLTTPYGHFVPAKIIY